MNGTKNCSKFYPSSKLHDIVLDSTIEIIQDSTTFYVKKVN